MNSPNIFFSVGEPSGDQHAAKLLTELRQQRPGATFRGFGGRRMKMADCHIDYQLTDLAVVGFTEVLPKLREFFRVADVASDIFARERPDAVVLVDFPGFNWHIAKRAKKQGIPVFYYLPPQLWAWGSWRIQKMQRYVDHVICNLPFEPEWYRQRGVSVDYVGHPFFDDVAQRPLDQRFLARWQNYEGLQVAVLPGSREREVKSIWPMQLAAIRELTARHPKTRFLVACLRDRDCLWCKQQLKAEDGGLNIEFFVGKTSEIIQLADCSLMKSGSVSLEMMARGTPAVVVYHVSRMTHQIVRLLSHVDSFSLPNLIAQRSVMPEFLAIGSTGTAIEKSVAAMDRLLGDSDERGRQRRDLLDLSRRFAKAGASREAAAVVLRKLGDDSAKASHISATWLQRAA